MEVRPVRVPTALGDVAVRVLGEGRPTVLWHSMFVDGTSWDRVVPHIATGRRLLVVDGPGWGRSAPLQHPTTVTASVEAAVELLRVLAPDAPVDWIGNGWGGHVGMELAATRPGLVRSLVAISAPPEPITPRLRLQIRALVPVLRGVGFVGPVRKAILDGILTESSQRKADLVDAVGEALRRPGRASVANAVQSFVLDRVDITELLPRIAVPTLLVAGDSRGDWGPDEARRTAAFIAGARAVVVPGSRTLVPLEQPEVLATELLGFLAAVPYRR